MVCHARYTESANPQGRSRGRFTGAAGKRSGELLLTGTGLLCGWRFLEKKVVVNCTLKNGENATSTFYWGETGV